MFNRSVINDLQQWAKKSDRKPLILRGARQVGKTTVVGQFAAEFDQYIYLNLEIPINQKIFNQHDNIDDLVNALFLQHRKSNNRNLKTLVFLDEIQNSPKAVEMLRYFYEKASHLFVICAGSLLETMIDKNIHFPVGRVEYNFMYPLSFEEFLLATEEQQLHELITNKNILPKYSHENLKQAFHKYTMIGGMPEVVAKYQSSQDLLALQPIYQNLLLAYLDDAQKYAENKTTASHIGHVIEQLPFSAGKRIKFHGFGNSNYGSKEMGEALRTIEKAMLIKLIYPTTRLQLPIVPNYKKAPKLQFLDTGLMNYSLGLQIKYLSINDLSAIYSGLITEHIVMQEVIASKIITNQKPCFWVREKGQSNAEIDLVLPYKNTMIPIEIKAGKTGTLRSLHQFIDETNYTLAVRLYGDYIQLDKLTTPKGTSYKLLNLPYYLAGKIMHYMDLDNYPVFKEYETK